MCCLIMTHIEKILKISPYNMNVCINTEYFYKVCSRVYKGTIAFIFSDHVSCSVPVSQVVDLLYHGKWVAED